MEWGHYISYVFGGMFLGNAIPHLVSGMTGRAFQSPFSKPPGEGLSSSTVNVLWAAVNLVIGYCLVSRVGTFDLGAPGDAAALGLGLLVIGLICARLFGRFHGGNSARLP